MSTAPHKEAIKMIRARVNRLVMRITIIRMQRRLFGISLTASISAFSGLATYSLSIKTFFLKRILLRLSCKFHPLINCLLQKSENLIGQQCEAEDRAQVLMKELHFLKSNHD